MVVDLQGGTNRWVGGLIVAWKAQFTRRETIVDGERECFVFILIWGSQCKDCGTLKEFTYFIKIKLHVHTLGLEEFEYLGLGIRFV